MANLPFPSLRPVSTLSGAAFALCFSLFGSACTTPQSWTTARTLSPGRVQHALGFEASRQKVEQKKEVIPTFDADDRCSDGEPCRRVLQDSLVPSVAYGVRVGALPRLEMGAKVSSSGQLQVDTKLQVLRRPLLDFAINPVYTTSMTFDRSELRALGLFSLNLGRRLTFTAAPNTGIAMWHPTRSGKIMGDSDVGILSGVGLAAQVRFNRFAITPSIDVHQTRWRSRIQRANDRVVAIGLGFSWGAMPQYGLIRRR